MWNNNRRMPLALGTFLLVGLSLMIPKEAVAQAQGLFFRVQALEAAVASLESQVAGLQAGLASETAARQAADAALQAALDSEMAARQAADAALQAAIGAGGAGVSGWEIVLETGPSNSDPYKVLTANCPPGKKVLGGGGLHWVDVFAHGWPDDHLHISLLGSFPDWSLGEGQGWQVQATEDPQGALHPGGGTPAQWKLQAFAVCANVAP